MARDNHYYHVGVYCSRSIHIYVLQHAYTFFLWGLGGWYMSQNSLLFCNLFSPTQYTLDVCFIHNCIIFYCMT